MKSIEVRFEQDGTLELIEVLVRAPERNEETDALMERISGKPPNLLTVTETDGTQRRIAVGDVVSVSVSGKESQIVTEGAVYTVRQSLQRLEAVLGEEKFVRISRYELVNLEKVTKYDFTLNGTLRLELAGGIETWASRRCIPDIRRRINGKG